MATAKTNNAFFIKLQTKKAKRLARGLTTPENHLAFAVNKSIKLL